MGGLAAFTCEGRKEDKCCGCGLVGREGNRSQQVRAAPKSTVPVARCSVFIFYYVLHLWIEMTVRNGPGLPN